MAHINLLPWREERRKEQQKDFAILAVGGIVIAGLLVLLVHLRLDGMIKAQDARNNFLKTEISKLDKKIEEIKNLEDTKNKLLARMNIIQQLQRDRPVSVHLVDELVRSLPDGVYLTKFTQKGAALVLSGVAESNARVSAYMRNIDASDWLANPKLDFIKTREDGRRRVAEFTLRAIQKKGPDDGSENSEADAG